MSRILSYSKIYDALQKLSVPHPLPVGKQWDTRGIYSCLALHYAEIRDKPTVPTKPATAKRPPRA